MGDEGCTYLARSDWNLIYVNLRTKYLKKVPMALGNMELINYHNAIGTV